MPNPGFQVTIDCAEPDLLARFWAEALHYELEGPPEPHETWRGYWISVGVPGDEVDDGYDSIIDPTGRGPRMWFQQVPEEKTVKNRLHFDLLVGGGRTNPLAVRKRRVAAEVARLENLGATIRRVMNNIEADHYAVGMSDPEGNEFDIV
ncbi:MAG: VOC family protein [Actinomycetota bacterium]|nr:VOC family protein [Actinomycetota bacterium]